MTRSRFAPSLGRRRVIVVAAGVAALLGVGGVASASWQRSVAVSGSGAATSVQAVANASVSLTVVSSTEIDVKVTAVPATGPTPSSYLVKNGSTTVCATVALNATCQNTGLTANTQYTYNVFSNLGTNWVSSASASVSGTTLAGANFLLTPATGTRTAGAAFSVTIQARNGTTNDTSYTGSKTLSITDTNTAPDGVSSASLSSTTVTFGAGGSATVNVSLFDAISSNTFTIADASPSTRQGSATVTVAAGPAALSFVNTTVGGSSVTCSPTVAINPGGNNTVLQTRVKLLNADSWGNAVTLPNSGTVTVDMTANPTSGFNNFTNPTQTITLPTTTSPSGSAYSQQRSNGSSYTGTLTASDHNGTYASATCKIVAP